MPSEKFVFTPGVGTFAKKAIEKMNRSQRGIKTREQERAHMLRHRPDLNWASRYLDQAAGWQAAPPGS